MLGIVLAGGNGTRFSESGCCKPLLKVNGKYLIEYSLENLIALHVDRALIVVGKYRNEITAALGDRYRSLSLSYAVQEMPAGCIHALYCALPYWNGETVVLQLSDEIYLGFDAAAVKKAAEADFLCGYTLVTDRKDVRENYAVYCAGKQEKVLRCEEKPQTVHNNRKGTGFCVFQPDCIRFLREQYPSSCDHYVSLCDLMNRLIEQGKTGLAVRIADEEININTTEKLRYAAAALRGTTQDE